MIPTRMLAGALLLIAVPASANPGYAPAAGVLFLLLLPTATVLLSAWGGAYAVFRAKGGKPWGASGVIARAVFMTALLAFGSLMAPTWLLCFLIITIHSIVRGIRMLIWGRAAGKPEEVRPAFLAEARPRRLFAAGGACLALIPLVFLSAGIVTGGYSDGGVGIAGNLGFLRSALSIYYGDTKGRYPADLSELAVGGKYIQAIPAIAPSVVKWPGNSAWNLHPPSNAVRYGKASDDKGGWLYDNVVGDPEYGSVWVNCTHTDRRGTVWSAY